MTSPDGRRWTPRWTPDSTTDAEPYLTGVAAGNGRVVALGPRQTVFSRDLASWTLAPVPRLYRSVAFGNGVFVAVKRSRNS